MLDKAEFTKCMLEKLVWISAFMLVGARHGGCTVGEVEAQVGGRGAVSQDVFLAVCGMHAAFTGACLSLNCTCTCIRACAPACPAVQGRGVGGDC